MGFFHLYIYTHIHLYLRAICIAWLNWMNKSLISKVPLTQQVFRALFFKKFSLGEVIHIWLDRRLMQGASISGKCKGLQFLVNAFRDYFNNSCQWFKKGDAVKTSRWQKSWEQCMTIIQATIFIEVKSNVKFIGNTFSSRRLEYL